MAFLILRITKAITADDGIVVDDNAVSNSRSLSHRHPGMNDAVVANNSIVVNGRVRHDPSSCADFRARPNHCTRIDRNVLSNFSSFVNDGGGMSELFGR